MSSANLTRTKKANMPRRRQNKETLMHIIYGQRHLHYHQMVSLKPNKYVHSLSRPLGTRVLIGDY